ncbi:MAG TPA: helix-turn-helix domain-containing protein [Anaerolineales bacterium]|jgi:excisionase family DNA binding protein
MPGEWLNLSEASEILGVHPSTVRNWSDQGYLPVHRTQGGHRRFKRSEVDLWMKSQRKDAPDEGHLVVQNALRSTRIQIGEGRLESEGWYRKLDEEARAQYRRSGRNLLQGLLGFLSSDEPVAEAEARSLGYEYASRGWRCGLSTAEASMAFLFFRNVLMDSMLEVYEGAAVPLPGAWGNMFRKINAFTDQIQITLLETYDAYQRGSR